MAAVPQSTNSRQFVSRRPLPRSGRAPLRSIAAESRANRQKQEVVQMQAAPSWIGFLVGLQRASSMMTLVLVVAALAAYSWTVYTQERWGHAYSKLEALQKRERQLIATNEVLKDKMAQQAEDPGLGLVPPSLDSAIFLTPAPQRSAVEPSINSSKSDVPERPLGY